MKSQNKFPRANRPQHADDGPGSELGRETQRSLLGRAMEAMHAIRRDSVSESVNAQCVPLQPSTVKIRLDNGLDKIRKSCWHMLLLLVAEWQTPLSARDNYELEPRSSSDRGLAPGSDSGAWIWLEACIGALRNDAAPVRAYLEAGGNRYDLSPWLSAWTPALASLEPNPKRPCQAQAAAGRRGPCAERGAPGRLLERRGHDASGSGALPPAPPHARRSHACNPVHFRGGPGTTLRDVPRSRRAQVSRRRWAAVRGATPPAAARAPTRRASAGRLVCAAPRAARAERMKP